MHSNNSSHVTFDRDAAAACLRSVRIGMPEHARAVRAQFELAELIHSRVTDPEIFRVSSSQNHAGLFKLDCVALPPASQPGAPEELKKSRLAISVDGNERAWNEIVSILQSLHPEGVVPREKTQIEKNETLSFNAQNHKFSFRGFPIYFVDTEFFKRK